MDNINPLGLHVQQIKAPNRDWTISYLRDNNIVTSTFLDDPSMAARAAVELPFMKYPVYRKYGFEPNPDRTMTRSYLKTWTGEVYRTVKAMRPHKNVLVNINCEQQLHPNLMLMYVELAHLAANDPDPVGMVFCNNASGSVRNGFWASNIDGHLYVPEANWWTTPEAMEYLTVMHQYRNRRLPSGAYMLVHGSHYYTSGYPTIAFNGGLVRNPRAWVDQTLKIDWSKPQDHLGRDYQAQMMALGWRWDGNGWRGGSAEAPYTLITEELIDDMGDVYSVLRNIPLDPPFQRPQGYNSLRRWWKEIYPDISNGDAGVVLQRMRQWAWKTIYAPTGVFLGTQNFSQGDTGGFQSHTTYPDNRLDVAFYNTGFKATYPDHMLGGATVPPMYRYVAKVAGTPVETLNLRAFPRGDAGISGSVALNAKVQVLQENVDGWAQIIDSIYGLGWISLQGGNVQLLEALPSDPPDETPETPTAPIIDQIMKLRQQRSGLWMDMLALELEAQTKHNAANEVRKQVFDIDRQIMDLTDEVIGSIIVSND